jgi:hypothetical protein
MSNRDVKLLVLPMLVGIAGSILFGYTYQYSRLLKILRETRLKHAIVTRLEAAQINYTAEDLTDAPKLMNELGGWRRLDAPADNINNSDMEKLRLKFVAFKLKTQRRKRPN